MRPVCWSCFWARRDSTVAVVAVRLGPPDPPAINSVLAALKNGLGRRIQHRNGHQRGTDVQKEAELYPQAVHELLENRGKVHPGRNFFSGI